MRGIFFVIARSETMKQSFQSKRKISKFLTFNLKFKKVKIYFFFILNQSFSTNLFL